MFRHLLIATLLFVTPARAETVQATDFEAFEAAKEMLDATGFDSQLEEVALRMADLGFQQAMIAQEKEHGIEFPGDLRAEIRTIMLLDVQSTVVELKETALDDAAHIYASRFSPEELRKLQMLQSDPVMVKLQRLLPTMMPELAKIGMEASAEREPALKRKVEEVVRRWLEANQHRLTKS